MIFQGGQQPGKPGNPGKVKEFHWWSGKIYVRNLHVFYASGNMANTCIVLKSESNNTVFSSVIQQFSDKLCQSAL
jgi:hypothetical protein